MLFGRRIFGGRVMALVLGAGLVMCPSSGIAQRGGGGGAPTAGGLVGPNTSGGVSEKDQLKSFHRAMAVQASSQQSAEFRVLVKNTEAANQEFEELQKDLGKGNDAAEVSSGTYSSGASALRQALEQARIKTRKFLEGFSAAQKSGLKEVSGRLLKAESELGEQEKTLDASALDAHANDARANDAHAGESRSAEAKSGEIKSVARVESLYAALGKALANFRKEQDSLRQEMGIVLSEGEPEVAFTIAPFRSSMRIANQPVAIATSAVISRVAAESGGNVFKVEATTDLSDMQQNMTPIVSALLNKGERCGERIEVANATLDPAAPSSVAVQLHYERWVCRRMGGGETSNEVAEGNATVEVKLTPTMGPDGKLEIASEIGRVEADRFLADLVRTGALGDALRGKIARSMMAAITDLKGALPTAVRDSAKAQSARFESTPAGGVNAIVSGEMRISEEQVKLLGSQLKERVAARAGTQ